MINGSTKYYNLFSNEELLSEYIRINNIGQLFIVWISYEKYLRDKYRNDYGLEKFKIKDVFDDLINKNNPKNKIQIIEEFEIIRNTRNSLHDGGIYNINFSHFKGKLCNKEYIFTPGSSVKPLRIIDVIKTIWSHYKEFEKINN